MTRASAWTMKAAMPSTSSDARAGVAARSDGGVSSCVADTLHHPTGHAIPRSGRRQNDQCIAALSAAELPPTPTSSRSGASPDAERRHRQVWHLSPGEEPAAGNGHQPRPSHRAIHARAVGGDAGVRIHLPVDFRDEQECEPRLDRADGAARACPRASAASRSDPTRPACGGESRRGSSPGARCRPSAAAPGE